MQTLSASRRGQTFKPFQAPADAPVYSYNVKPNNINTYGIKDTAGQEWYLTDQANWRNVGTGALSKTMPTYQAATPAQAPVTSVQGAPDPVQTQPASPQTFRSAWDFTRNQDQGMFNPMPSQPITKVNDMMPTNWQDTQAYKFAMDRGNKELDKSLAARGLLGSNVELEQRNDLIQRVGADETQRQIQMAQQDAGASNERFSQEMQARQQLQQLLAQLAQSDAATFYGNYNQDANREIDKDNQRLVAMQSALDYIKSLNPMQYGFQAIDSLANLDKGLGSAWASAVGSGGGSRGGAAPTSSAIATMPTNPSAFNPTNYWLQAGSSILPQLLNAFK